METKNGVFLFSMLTIYLCGAALFLVGFFPDAYNKPETKKNEDFLGRPTKLKSLSIVPPKRQHAQFILMLIDALRVDFLHHTENVKFMKENTCVKRFKLRVAIPTVTMPRLKSLTTGTISNFIDIIRNLGEAEQLNDSLLHRLRNHGDMINFGGDRTWVTLFPSEFTRKTPNVDSFFVQDFYEGDKNVAATLSQEINQTDWTLLILHFLGLDHIGHVEGSNSVKIPPKLMEMDNVVRTIVENKFFSNRLLLVTGDHGMRDGGGHGGSTTEELYVPLLVYKQNCSQVLANRDEYNQIDLTPTLAILLSIEIPKPSIGRLIPELLSNLSIEDQLYAYFYNAHHLIYKAMEKYGEKNVKQTGYAGWFEHAQVAHEQYLETKRTGMPGSFYYQQALANYKRVADEISERMSESLVTFDNSLIAVGLFLTTMVTIAIIIYLLFTERKLGIRNSTISVKRSAISLVTAISTLIICHFTDSIPTNSVEKSLLLTLFIAIGIYIATGVLSVLQKLLLPLHGSTASFHFYWSFPMPLLMSFILTIVVLGSSSFIEYEEKAWFYLGATNLMLLTTNEIRYRFQLETYSGINEMLVKLRFEYVQMMPTLVLLIATRLLRMLNARQNGDFIEPLQHPENIWLSVLFILSLLWLLKLLKAFNTPKRMVACALTSFFIYTFRGIEGKLLFLPIGISAFAALLLFSFSLAVTAFLGFKVLLQERRDNLKIFLQSTLTCSLLIGALLHKPHNVILVPCLLFILKHVYNYCDRLRLKIREPYRKNHILAYKTLMTIFIANMFFFYQGNSNSLATIDLNPGYIGQDTYKPFVVAILVTMNTYSAPINAFLYFILHIATVPDDVDERTASCDEDLQLALGLYTASTLLPVSVYLCLMLVFRYHLFIYSVFAPKVFYECYRVVVFYLSYCFIKTFIYVFK